MDRILRPVAGTPGDLFPCRVVDLVEVLLDGKIYAAHRAAEGNGLSTYAKLDFFAAHFALHKNLNQPQRHRATEKPFTADGHGKTRMKK